jgi:hypothetical protein
MVFGVSLVQAQEYGVTLSGDTGNFTTAENVDPTGPGSEISLDIYLTGVGAPQNAGGVWVDFTGSTADITYVSAGRALTDGSEGITGPWPPGGVMVNEPALAGTLMMVLADLGAGASPDGDGNLFIGNLVLQSTGPAAAPATVDFTVLTSPTWTPIEDSAVTPGSIVISTVCEFTTDDMCDDGNYCNGEETWDQGCGCNLGTPPCATTECTIDCDEDLDECLTEPVCDPASVTASTDPCCSDSPCAGDGSDPQPICAADFTLTKESGFYQPPAGDEVVTIKNRICLNNPDVLIGGIQFDLVDDPDCLTCIDCELTERTVMFDCVVLELPDGSCRVIMFCKNPGCAINPGECNIVTVVMQTNGNEECGDGCIAETITNIVASDYDGFALAGADGSPAGTPATLCPVVCGDVCPPGSGEANDCGDGVVDIYDIMCEVDFALTATTANECQLPRADVPTGTPPNCFAPDGEINILDIMVLIDSALNRQDCCSFYYTGIIY